MKARFSASSLLLVGLFCGIIGAYLGGELTGTRIVDAGYPLAMLHSQLGVALENYRNERGSYPSVEQGLSVLLGTNGGPEYFRGDLKDPAGRPIQYFLIDGKPVIGFFTYETSWPPK